MQVGSDEFPKPRNVLLTRVTGRFWDEWYLTWIPNAKVTQVHAIHGCHKVTVGDPTGAVLVNLVLCTIDVVCTVCSRIAGQWHLS